MFIKNEDFDYLKKLMEGMNEERKKRLMETLVKMVGKRICAEVGKIKVVGDDIYDRQGVDPKDFITRTMIKKAFKEVKDGK